MNLSLILLMAFFTLTDTELSPQCARPTKLKSTNNLIFIFFSVFTFHAQNDK